MASARIFALTAATLSLIPLLSACAVLRDVRNNLPFMPGDPAMPVEAAQVSTAGMPGALEPIHGAAFTGDLAVFRVSSNGCTDRDDITPIVSRPRPNDVVITLRRVVEDTCKARDDDGVELIWSFEELGVDPGAFVEVNNPYLMPAVGTTPSS